MPTNPGRKRRTRALALCAPALFIFLYACAAGDAPPGGANASPTRAQTPHARGDASDANADAPDAARAGDESNADTPADVSSAPGDDAAPPEDETGDDSSQDFKGTAAVSEKKREGTAPAVLRSVRAARHGAFDRVVFEFEGRTPPGYRVEYVDRPVRQCGSGDTVALAGDAWLRVRLQPAQAHTEAGRPTVTQRERRLRLGVLREMKLTCDFEAEVEWVFGLAAPKRYRVLELKRPTRLVVDIRR
ncbi:MAG TPA: hypothetical protein VGV38_15420 [Pyrinomonadaceae bacterium]|nr:hypothetical protein [Pyrinomonadaceae bacterium]